MIPIRTSVDVQDIPSAVVGLIIANVLVFLFMIGLPPDLAEQFINHNALVPARYTQPELARNLGLDPFNFLPLLTNFFMHAGWLHLIVNMWTLWLFGKALEERLGTPRFVLLYLVCGVIANLAHLAFNLDSPVPVLGASGAIAGVLGAYTLLYPRARIALLTPVLFFPVVFQLPAAVYTAIWFAFQLLQGITELFAPERVFGIAWWAHIGGAIAGLVLIRILRRAPAPVREIGPAPPAGVREIGALRPRVVTLGPVQRQRHVAGVFARLPGRLPALPRQRRATTLTLTPEAAVPPSETPWQSATAPPAAAVTSAREGRAPASADETRRTGRSMIPQSGQREEAASPETPSSSWVGARLAEMGRIDDRGDDRAKTGVGEEPETPAPVQRVQRRDPSRRLLLVPLIVLALLVLTFVVTVFEDWEWPSLFDKPSVVEALTAYDRGDHAAAYRGFEPLAEKGDAVAQNAFGVMYENGQGVAQDHAEAVKWYRKAAMQGQAKAQYALGKLYLSGRGVTVNPGQTYFWLTLVADREPGQVDERIRSAAIGLRARAGANLTPRQKTQARAQARAWRPESGAEQR